MHKLFKNDVKVDTRKTKKQVADQDQAITMKESIQVKWIEKKEIKDNTYAMEV